MSFRFFDDDRFGSFDPFSSFFQPQRRQSRPFMNSSRVPRQVPRQEPTRSSFVEKPTPRKATPGKKVLREELEMTGLLRTLEANCFELHKLEHNLEVIESLREMLESQGLIKIFCKTGGLQKLLEIALERRVSEKLRVQVLITLSDIVSNNHHVQKHFMRLPYCHLLKNWYESDLDLQLKTISLFAGIIGGNNLEIKRDFLQNQGFGVFVQFLEEITRLQKPVSLKETQNKIIAKLLQIIEDLLRYEEFIDSESEVLNMQQEKEIKSSDNYEHLKDFSKPYHQLINFLLERITANSFSNPDLKEQNLRLVLFRTISVFLKKSEISQCLKDNLISYRKDLESLVLQDEYYLNEISFVDQIIESF